MKGQQGACTAEHGWALFLITQLLPEVRARKENWSFLFCRYTHVCLDVFIAVLVLTNCWSMNKTWMVGARKGNGKNQTVAVMFIKLQCYFKCWERYQMGSKVLCVPSNECASALEEHVCLREVSSGGNPWVCPIPGLCGAFSSSPGSWDYWGPQITGQAGSHQKYNPPARNQPKL